MKKPITAYHLLWVLLVCVTLCASSLFIALRVNRNTEEKFCATAISRDDGFKQAPPDTPSGRTQAQVASDLVKRLHCPVK